MRAEIIVRCDKGKFTNLARLTADHGGLLVEYGRWDEELGHFWPVINETLLYQKHPELIGIYDGYSWDVLMLSDLVNEHCRESE